MCYSLNRGAETFLGLVKHPAFEISDPKRDVYLIVARIPAQRFLIIRIRINGRVIKLLQA